MYLYIYMYVCIQLYTYISIYIYIPLASMFMGRSVLLVLSCLFTDDTPLSLFIPLTP